MSIRLLGQLPALAWLTLWLLSSSPYAYVLGHEVLGERRFSPPVATLLFAAGWLLMSVAMMMPGAWAALRPRGLPARLDRVSRTAGPATFPAAFVASFLGAFMSVWLAFGFVFAFADLLVHAWLEPSRPEIAALLPGFALLVAGIWLLLGRFVPPPDFSCAVRPEDSSAGHGLEAGWRHGLRCLWSCWALMLAMAAVGHGNVPVMLGFAVLMGVARRAFNARSERLQGSTGRLEVPA